MAGKTPRCLWISGMLAVLVMPFLMVVWPPILGTGDDEPRAFVAGLSAAELEEAGRAIDEYPYVYRREIMRALTPAKRAAAWRRYIARYLDSRPELSTEAIRSLRDVSTLLDSQFLLDRPSEETRYRLKELGTNVRRHLGDAEARKVLMRLGPDDTQPMKWNGRTIIAFLRESIVLHAEADCNCAVEDPDCGSGWYCMSQVPPYWTCRIDNVWPMCGTLWAYICNGGCQLIQ